VKSCESLAGVFVNAQSTILTRIPPRYRNRKDIQKNEAVVQVKDESKSRGTRSILYLELQLQQSSSEKDSYVNMADNNNMIDEIDLFTTTHYIYDEDLCDNIADSKTSILWLLLFCYICRLYHIVVVCYT